MTTFLGRDFTPPLHVLVQDDHGPSGPHAQLIQASVSIALSHGRPPFDGGVATCRVRVFSPVFEQADHAP